MCAVLGGVGRVLVMLGMRVRVASVWRAHGYCEVVWSAEVK
jgi:hypothetical protein